MRVCSWPQNTSSSMFVPPGQLRQLFLSLLPRSACFLCHVQDLSQQVREASARVLHAVDWPEQAGAAPARVPSSTQAASLRSKPSQACAVTP